MKLSKFKVVISIFLITVFLVLGAFNLHGFKYKKLAKNYAKINDLDCALIIAIIKVESNFNKNAYSNKGAIGLMQVLPTTAEYILQISPYSTINDLFDEETNVKLGTYYFKYLINKFKSEDVAICAYNAGEGTVQKWGLSNGFSLEKIKYNETLNYYKKVKFYKNLYGIFYYD